MTHVVHISYTWTSSFVSTTFALSFFHSSFFPPPLPLLRLPFSPPFIFLFSYDCRILFFPPVSAPFFVAARRHFCCITYKFRSTNLITPNKISKKKMLIKKGDPFERHDLLGTYLLQQPHDLHDLPSRFSIFLRSPSPFHASENALVSKNNKSVFSKKGVCLRRGGGERPLRRGGGVRSLRSGCCVD